MRMWNTYPRYMCRQHLLGEHCELHMFAGIIARRKSISGYVEKNLVEPESIRRRHAELVIEMERRGYKHSSLLKPLINLDLLPLKELHYRLDEKKACAELLKRCPRCKESFENPRNIFIK